ncbi:MAG: glycosyltransferase [Hyphomicrobiales bacterium]|nr:glycosyltransferase [Hyphomicrobiales bacterium]
MTNNPYANENNPVATVLIGRNEGERLIGCLKSVTESAGHAVYVDSGSTDGSVTAASEAGAEVVQLDMSRPFTAARARNAGYAALEMSGAPFRYVQFIDGDCQLVPGWIEAGRKALSEDASLGVVTGWRSEINRNRSIYNALCDFEWRRAAGEIRTCGGDMMVRREAFETAGGFDDTVIAAEDDDFCVRIRKAGWKIRRLPVEMTRHDAAMLRFSQWWQRAIRSGHGFAQVGALHPDYFVTERRRVLIFGGLLPAVALAGLVFGLSWMVLAVAGLYALSYVRTALGLRREGLPMREALTHAVFLSLSKFPNLLGMLTYWRRRMSKQDMEIIEYKHQSQS